MPSLIIYSSYLNQHILNYAEETRWPDESFWSSRAGIIYLAPNSVLTKTKLIIEPEKVNCKWLNLEYTNKLLACINKEESCSDIVGKYIKLTNHAIGARRTILGLQWAVESGLAIIKTVSSTSA